MARRHRNVLLAGLVVIGGVMWIAMLAFFVVEPDKLSRSVAWFTGALIAAYVARRVLVLDVGETTVAALVMSAIVMGIFLERRGEALHVEVMIPISIAGIGALLGALAVRARSDKPHAVWLVVASGLGAFGMAVLAGACGEVIGGNTASGLAVFGGAIAGSFVVAIILDVAAWHCVLGLAIVFATATLQEASDVVKPIVAFVMGALLGAIGGRIGIRVRTARQRNPAPDLPSAQVR